MMWWLIGGGACGGLTLLGACLLGARGRGSRFEERLWEAWGITPRDK